jgi:hypothetical protein
VLLSSSQVGHADIRERQTSLRAETRHYWTFSHFSSAFFLFGKGNLSLLRKTRAIDGVVLLMGFEGDDEFHADDAFGFGELEGVGGVVLDRLSESEIPLVL